MRFKKRYIPIIFAAGLIGLSRLPLLSMRKSDAKQMEYLKEKIDRTPEIGDYKVGKQSIHFLQMSDCEEKPVVILVHGSPGSSNGFIDYLADAELRKIAQIVAVDRPGFGFSGFGKTERSLEKQAAALYPILKMYEAQKVVLVGHSFGGPLIARMAMDYPDLVDGLVMVAGSIDPKLEPKEWWRPVLNAPVIRWLLPPALKVANQEILPLWKELELMLPLWETITCPATIIQGESDKLVPAGNAEFAKKMLINSEKVEMKMIPEGNHFILWSRQEYIVAEIVKMMRQLDGNKEHCMEVQTAS